MIRYLVETNTTDNPRRARFDREILVALEEFRKSQEREEKLR